MFFIKNQNNYALHPIFLAIHHKYFLLSLTLCIFDTHKKSFCEQHFRDQKHSKKLFRTFGLG